MKQDEAFEALIKYDIFGSVMSSSSLSGCSFYIFLSQVYSVSGFFKLSLAYFVGQTEPEIRLSFIRKQFET